MGFTPLFFHSATPDQRGFVVRACQFKDAAFRSTMKYDLHVHTAYSPDGSLSPENVVRIAKSRGLRGIAMTDHNTIKGGIDAH
jgi:DNA polymerase III alpha subunit (gram-positive type)